jgi:hypothetical protein
MTSGDEKSKGQRGRNIKKNSRGKKEPMGR